ncbi:MAG: peptide chain release factor N(5)-glutamine methyltransferase [Bacilli bacterium]|nr:peptide chain release factor N(5)-glutamine methyltransferase [Bacilli bacterium]
MRVEDLLIYGKSHCHSDHAKILLAELIGKNPLELLMNLNEIVPEEKAKLYKEEILALEAGKPLQYVMGYVNFYGNQFYVNENVLIPRFETEELVENTINYINQNYTEPVDIIDLGCGSGVIGLTLEKKVSTNSVDLVDISKEALKVTHKNCEKLNSKANIIESDFFTNITKKYDIVISNPPYIKENEEIEEIVKNNEPSLALYAGADGLDCYRKILKTVKKHLKEKSIIAFEIGYTQANDITKIAQEELDNIQIIVKKDLSGKDRMLFIFKNIV